MILYHLTSSKNMKNILKEGLKNPYLTDSLEIAEYYAECSCHELGGNIVILKVEFDEENLRYDGAAMDEPVKVGENKRNEQWRLAEEEHPEWVNNGYIVIPSNEYNYSEKKHRGYL